MARIVKLEALHLGIAAIFITTLALCGGSSFAELLSPMVARTVAVVAIVYLLITTDRNRADSGARLAFGFLAAATVIMLVQLIPLPPGVWSALPGRALYLEAAEIAGTPQPWRPINLTPDLGIDATLSLLIPWATTMLYFRFDQHEKSLAIGGFLAICFVSGVLGVLQLSLGPDSPLFFYDPQSAGAPVGLFANRNHQALLLALAIPAIPVFLASERRRLSTPLVSDRFETLLGIGCSALLGMVLITTGSRSGAVLGGLGVLTAVYFWRGVSSQKAVLAKGKRTLRFAAIALTLPAAVLGLAIIFNRDTALQRLANIGTHDDIRSASAEPLLAMLWAFFPVGSGFGSFAPVFLRFERLEDLRHTYLNQAHNDLMQVVIEGGLAGLALLVAYAVWWLIRSWQIWRSSSTANGALRAKLGSVATLLLVLGSLTDYPMRAPLMACIFCLFSIMMLDRRVAEKTVTDDRR